VFSVLPIYYCLVVSTTTSAIDCLERLVSEMAYCMLNGMLNYTHSLTYYGHSLINVASSRQCVLILDCADCMILCVL